MNILNSNIIAHNRSNYYGISERIESMPHFLGSLVGTVQQLARTNQFSPTAGGLWQGTPISDRIVGKAHASAPAPAPKAPPKKAVLPASTGQGGAFPISGGFQGNTSGGGGGTPVQSAPQNFDQGFDMGMDDTNRLIDEAYGASSGYLNEAENALRGDHPTILAEIAAQQEAGLRTAGQGRESSLGQVAMSEQSAQMRNENVMADARRLYDELRRGYGQRFGGASSAGQAATELGNLEQQRQMGRTQQEYTQTLKQVEAQKVAINQKFEDQKFQLEQTKNQAVNEANRDFQNKLLQISQSRAENEQAKAQARLSALQDLRNKVYQINLQNLQFQQSLALQKQQDESTLSSYSQSLANSVSGASNAVGNFNPLISSNLQVGDGGGQGAVNPLMGFAGTLPGRDDELFGQISPRRQDFLS